MHMEMVYRDRILMIDTNHIEFCQLPQKYDIDLEQLREGLRSVNAFELERPLWYNLPRNLLEARELMRNDAPIHLEGYSGICFKSEKGMENDLYQGLAYDGILKSSNVAGPSDVGIDSTFTERNDMWFPYLTEIESKFKGQVTQMRLLKLHAGHNLGRKMHTDYPWYKGLRLHIPLNDSTKYMITRERLALMKPGAVLINTARGGLIDESALKERLMGGHIAAALDVFSIEPPHDQELLELPNLLVTPHIGGSSHEAIFAMGRAAIDGLDNNEIPSSNIV